MSDTPSAALLATIERCRKRMWGLCHLRRIADVGSAVPGPEELTGEAAANEPTTVLTASLDPDATLVDFARLTVPVFADWCTVDVAAGDGLPRRLAVLHADTSKRRAAETLARYPHDPRMEHPRSDVWRSGRPNLAPEVPDARLVAAARSEEHLAVLRALGCRSSLAVPLTTEAGVFGVITFALAESRREYCEADLPLGLTLARCAAFAAEKARLYHQAQEALRPGIGRSPARRSQPRRSSEDSGLTHVAPRTR
jgi:hypothetical protein